MSAKDIILKVEHIKKEFPVKSGILIKRTIDSVKAVDGVSFELEKGKTLGIIGESGSGKTTLMRVIMGLEKHTSGSIHFDREEIYHDRNSDFRRNVQMIFQDSYASLDPRMTIKRILEEPFRVHFKDNLNEKNAEMISLLKRVGLPEDVLEKHPHELSGGQRQRISIARALATKPSLIVCDEPTSSLDVSTQAQILNLLKELQRELNITFLFVSHNMSVIRFISHDVMVMKDGKTVEYGNKTEIFNNPTQPYTKKLIEAVPVPDPAYAQSF